MKKNTFNACIVILNLIVSTNILAHNCKQVYTLGAYDAVFAKQLTAIKLGPLPATEVPPVLPKSFLEKDGHYGGGEAFCSIAQACQALKNQLASGVLPKSENWHIYILDADWKLDTYELHPNDFRIKHPVKVLRQVKKDC